ncbi:restriction endonuclease subunit S [Desulfosporosinus fructosivorans]
MSESKEKVPKIRFPGFTDAWEQRKLGELYTERKEPGYDSLQILSVSIHHGISNQELDSNTLGKKVRRSEDKSLYKHVYLGDLVLNMMRAWQGAIGVVKSEGMVSPAYITAIPSAELYPLFMDYCLRRDEAIIQMNNLSYGVTDFRKRLYWDSFINILCCIPSVPEQERITAFLTQLDNHIILHQRKLNNVKKLKAGLLQKMFPKDGEAFPEVRFPGFTSAWEQRVFSDLATRVSKSSDKNVLPRVEYEDIISSQGELNKNIFTKKSDKKGIEFELGDTLFGKLRPYLQNWLLADFNGIAVGDWWVLRPNEMDSKFIYSLIQSNKYETVANLSTGTKMPRSDWKLVSQTEFAVPTDIEEQVKIGQFFSNLDLLITLHQRKLKHLQEQKKALLQQMFV